MEQNRLSRNYIEQPIKVGEDLIYEDVYYLFWELNLTKKQVADIFGCGADKVYKFAKKHGLIKTQEMITASQKQLTIEKYGVDNVMKLSHIKEKCIESVNKAFKQNKEEIRQKKLNTFQEKYGCNNPSQNEEIKKKKINTCLKNYGVKNPQQSKEIKDKTEKTFKELYNGNPLSKESILQEQIKKVNLEKYGFENPMQNSEISGKTSSTLKHNQELYKKQNMEKYGVEYLSQLPEIRKKNSKGVRKVLPQIIETKRKNGTFNTSKPEEDVYICLLQKFNEKDIIRQYRSDLYPFACDFYITSLDLYIECNFCWTHGKEAFDKSNKEHILVLNEMKQRSLYSDFYKSAIYTWTDLDVRKLKTFKKNNLNYVIFYNMDEFLSWYKNI